MKIKITKGGFCFCLAMIIYATASTMEYNDIVRVQAAMQGER